MAAGCKHRPVAEAVDDPCSSGRACSSRRGTSRSRWAPEDRLAVAAGCTMVVKPAGHAADDAGAAQVLAEAGPPDGVLTIATTHPQGAELDADGRRAAPQGELHRLHACREVLVRQSADQPAGLDGARRQRAVHRSRTPTSGRRGRGDRRNMGEAHRRQPVPGARVGGASSATCSAPGWCAAHRRARTPAPTWVRSSTPTPPSRWVSWSPMLSRAPRSCAVGRPRRPRTSTHRRSCSRRRCTDQQRRLARSRRSPRSRPTPRRSPG